MTVVVPHPRSRGFAAAHRRPTHSRADERGRAAVTGVGSTAEASGRCGPADARAVPPPLPFAARRWLTVAGGAPRRRTAAVTSSSVAAEASPARLRPARWSRRRAALAVAVAMRRGERPERVILAPLESRFPDRGTGLRVWPSACRRPPVAVGGPSDAWDVP